MTTKSFFICCVFQLTASIMIGTRNVKVLVRFFLFYFQDYICSGHSGQLMSVNVSQPQKFQIRIFTPKKSEKEAVVVCKWSDLVKAQIDFCLDFVVEELFPEDGQSVVRRVVVEVQWVQDALHVGRVLGGQNVVSQDPRHRHLDWELDPFAHGHLQIKLAVPQLGQVAAVLQALCNYNKNLRVDK